MARKNDIDRYILSGKRKSKIQSKGKIFVHQNTTIYEDVPKRDSDVYVITTQGDRLDNLAYEYYGDQRYWWFIARVNHLKSLNVEPGTRLRIPTEEMTYFGPRLNDKY